MLMQLRLRRTSPVCLSLFFLGLYKNSTPSPTPRPLAQPSPFLPTKGREKFTSIRTGSSRYRRPNPTLRSGEWYNLPMFSANVRSGDAVGDQDLKKKNSS